MKTTSEAQIDVLIVDDHQMFIDGVKLLLNNTPNIKVVAEALNGIEALEIVKKQNPHLIITDINMPKMSGTELTKQVKEKYPDIKILVLTMYNDEEIINEILMSEADGYILKNTGRQELLNAINRIIDNGTYYSSEVISKITSNIKEKNIKRESIQLLTERELDILKLICKEYSNKEIAKKLDISLHTVESHRKHIFTKLNVKTVIGLVKKAINNNII